MIQNTPYIGQPAYKAMGGRAAYTLATAVFIGAAGPVRLVHPRRSSGCPRRPPFRSWSSSAWRSPRSRSGPRRERHFPAVALAILPALAYLALIPLDQALAGRPPAGHAAVAVQSLRCLANGFIVTSLLWASALAAMLDGSWSVRPATWRSPACAACSASSTRRCRRRRSPCRSRSWPRCRPTPAILCQSPYHWAAAYVLAAVLLILLHGAERLNRHAADSKP